MIWKKKQDLSRFRKAHKRDYQTALEEIRSGHKDSHWMWYIFPQIHGLGKRENSVFYAIKNLDEAKAFLADSYLGGNLREISSALLALSTDRPRDVFDKPDDRKLQSCMTLFALVSEDGSVFHKVLEKYFQGEMDYKTLRILRETGEIE